MPVVNLWLFNWDALKKLKIRVLRGVRRHRIPEVSVLGYAFAFPKISPEVNCLLRSISSLGNLIGNYRLDNSGRFTDLMIPDILSNLGFPLASGTYFYRLRQSGVCLAGCTRFWGNSMAIH